MSVNTKDKTTLYEDISGMTYFDNYISAFFKGFMFMFISVNLLIVRLDTCHFLR